MKLEKLEQESASAGERARNLHRKAERAGQIARAARRMARQAKRKLRRSKLDAKLARQAAKVAKRTFAEAMRAVEKADIQATLLERKVRKARQKEAKAAGRNGAPRVRTRATSRPSKRQAFASMRRRSPVAKKPMRHAPPVTRQARPLQGVSRRLVVPSNKLAIAAKPVASKRQIQRQVPREGNPKAASSFAAREPVLPLPPTHIEEFGRDPAANPTSSHTGE